jgi:outer membrane protein assembly factor BamB
MTNAQLSDANAFSAFYGRSLPRIYGYFLHRCGNNAAITNGTAFVSLSREGIDGRDVVAYNISNGGTIWDYVSKYIAAADRGIVIAGDSAYITGEGGFLFELSLADGSATTKYAFADGAATAQAMFVSAGRIVLTDYNGGLIILSGK